MIGSGFLSCGFTVILPPLFTLSTLSTLSLSSLLHTLVYDPLWFSPMLEANIQELQIYVSVLKLHRGYTSQKEYLPSNKFQPRFYKHTSLKAAIQACQPSGHLRGVHLKNHYCGTWHLGHVIFYAIYMLHIASNTKK